MKKIPATMFLGMVATAMCIFSGSAAAVDEFADDVAFMTKHTPIVLLQDGDAAVAVAPAYQGRVMTSTFDRQSGPSFGWINRSVIEIWMLGMYNPSPETTVVIPFKQGGEKTIGPRVNDTYFGKVPPEYLRVEKQKLFFKGDGTRRGKIGISPQRSKGIAGSYDAAGKVLRQQP